MTRLTFEPRPVVTPNKGGQEGFATDWESYIVAAEGGWYSGKTFIGARKLLTLHEYNAFDEDGEPTYVCSFIVAPTYSNAMDFCVPHFEDACDEAGLKYQWHGQGPLWGGRYSGPAIILNDFGTKKNPSVVLVRTADVPKRIAGFTAGAGWGDEPARWKVDTLDPLNDAFVQMTGRVRAMKARLLQILLTYTNEGDATRVYEEMHAGHKNRSLYRIPTTENPTAVKSGFYDMQKGNLTGELAAQYLDGKAAQLRGGRVYTSFDFDLHVDNKLTLRREIPLHIMLDFNIVPGMHLEVGQYHGDLDLLTVTHEIHGPRMDVKSAIDEFILLTKKINWDWNKTGPLEVFGDATGQSEWSGTGQSNYNIVQQKLKEQGVPYRFRVPKSNPLVQDRINAFNVAMYDIKGEIHWKCHPRCERLIDDLRKLQRDKYGEIETKDRKLSHASSAEGYRVEFIRPVRIVGSGVGGRVSW